MTHWKDAVDGLLKPLTTGEHVGLITDFDGTLSPIVPTPDAAAPTSGNYEALDKLHQLLKLVALVSGRGAADLSQRAGLPQLVYVGNHGLERIVDGAVEVAPEVAPYRPKLEAVLKEVEAHTVPGMYIEDKGATASIHYRNTPDPTAFAESVIPKLAELAEAHGLRHFGGRMVFEIRPLVEINKGVAFESLVREYTLEAAIWMGDDTTDADAMKVAQQLRADGVCHSVALGVIGDDTPSVVLESSDVTASGVEDVEAFLSWLVSARSASST